VKIGVLGGGRVGSALAETWREAGHDVSVSTRTTVAETAAHGEVVLLAVPAAAAEEVLAAAGSLHDKVLIDATNNLSGGPSGVEIAAFAPDTRTVKAFNTVFATFLHDTPPERPATVVICGDDPRAKEIVGLLAREVGLDPVDAGGSEQTANVEALARLVISMAYRQGRGPFVYRFEER
jgi:hypothetical protein